MREILFKAKRLDNGEWVEGFFVNALEEFGHGERIAEIIEMSAEQTFNGEYTYWKSHQVDPNTICQFTGLYDKNGNKIWENDVVRYTDELVGMVKQDLIVWSSDCCSFARKHKSKYTEGFQYLWINERISEALEVIGNIFDHSELLGGGE